MGSSSSQPVHEPSKSMFVSTATSPATERVPRYSPRMDDLAASQQLIDEGERAEHRTTYKEEPMLDDGAIESSLPAQVRKKRKSLGARKQKVPSTQQAAAASQVAVPKQPGGQLRSYALADLRAYTDSDETNEAYSGWPVSPLKSHAPNDVTPPRDDVEVPDSQTAPTTTDALMSPPMTSSFAVPASMPEKSSPKEKGKGRRRKEVASDKDLPDEEGTNRGQDTPRGANKVLTPSSSRSNRKRKHTGSAAPMLSSQTEPIHVSDVGEDTTVIPRNPQVGAAAETPTPAKRQKKAARKQSSRVWKDIGNGTLDAEDDIMDGPSQRSEKMRRSKKSAPRTPRAETEPELDGSLNTDMTTGVGWLTQVQNAENRTAHEGTPSARPKHGNKKHETNGTNVYDWSAPVRSLGEHVDENSAFGDGEEASDDADSRHADVEHSSRKRKRATRTKGKGNMPVVSAPDMDTFTPPETSLDEDETHSMPPPEHQHSAKKRSYKKARKSRRQSEIRPRIRTSNIGSSNTLTAAERSLNTVRDLNHPPNLQTSGDFTQDEEELIRRAIRDYQEREGLDTFELVEVIQWTNDIKNYGASHREKDPEEAQEEQESKEFWEEIKQINLTRKSETIRSHIRSKYHTYKRGGWTEEEDDELKNLYELHPRRWKLISQIMGDRSMQDVTNRWRDYVQHRDSRNTSTWSQDEESLLVRAITTVIQRDEDHRAEAGKPPLDDYTHKDINWAQVCSEMGDIRSRLQSQVKWTKMRARNPPPQIQLEIKPRKTPDPDQIVEQVVEPTPRKRGRPRKSENISVVGEGKSVEQPKRRRKSKKSLGVERQRPVADGSTPLPRMRAMASTPGVSQMRWGDKLDLMEAILTRAKGRAENIDWHDVATAMQYPWSVRTLQAAQQALFETVREKKLVETQAPFDDTADAILKYMAEEHAGELTEHYDPHADAELGQDMEFGDGDLGESATANVSNMKRKRKMSACESMPRSRSASAKKMKRQSRSRVGTPNTYKSAELIIDSEDAESEPEL